MCCAAAFQSSALLGGGGPNPVPSRPVARSVQLNAAQTTAPHRNARHRPNTLQCDASIVLVADSISAASQPLALYECTLESSRVESKRRLYALRMTDSVTASARDPATSAPLRCSALLCLKCVPISCDSGDRTSRDPLSSAPVLSCPVPCFPLLRSRALDSNNHCKTILYLSRVELTHTHSCTFLAHAGGRAGGQAANCCPLPTQRHRLLALPPSHCHRTSCDASQTCLL